MMRRRKMKLKKDMRKRYGMSSLLGDMRRDQALEISRVRDVCRIKYGSEY